MEREPMPDARVTAIATLLSETEAAHGAYEAAELGGVYDEAWPAWYAAYAIDHGIGDILGRQVEPDDLAAFLTRTYAEFEQTEPKQEPWQTYVARRIAVEL
jgi:hypothetical protein